MILVLFFLLLMFFSLISFFLFLMFMKFSLMYFLEWEILILNSNSFHMVIYLDWMTLIFLSVVFFISSLVCLYSIEYMEKKKNQFIYLIFLFVLSMMLFIISPSIVSVLIGWDGLGLVSYILIIFFQSNKSKNSGMLTLILNRIGDILIIFSSWTLYMLGGMNYLFYNDFHSVLTLVFIIVASMTKSAQMPFSSWLPAAMAAPTPVSSLVHSSTLVTAGIYLLIRFNSYFYLSINFMKMIFLVSTLTMLMSGIAANYEFDLKKIIALSTLSQLGLMMMTLSLGLVNLSLFHLLTHALFKALLFLCAGVIIHNYKNNQDIRKMGGVIFFMPLTIMCFNIANLSLCGFPFLSGFFSKDLIIENYFFFNKNLLIVLLLLLSTSLTVSYSFRLFYYLIFGKSNFFLSQVHESKLFSMILLLMAFMSLLSGSSLNWLMFNLFFEVKIMILEKFIVPTVLFMGFIMSMMFMNLNKLFFSSMWFLSFLSLYLKNIPFFFTEKMFFSSNFGFFEYFGGQGMMILSKKLIKGDLYLTSFKSFVFFSFLFFYLV